MKKRDAVDRPARGPFPLPTGDVPSSVRCISVRIPDGDDYEKLLAGALEVLTRWASYERDPEHKARLVATAWRNALFGETLWERCSMFDIRIDPENHCMLQKTIDGGDNWEDVGSFYDCAYGAGQDAVQDAIDDGTLGPGGQQPPASAPPANECVTYHVVLHASERWLCPVPISSAFTVRVTDAVGGWYDGDPFSGRWYCPSGKAYYLGLCASDIPYYGTDPLQAGNHMQVVANVGDDWGDPMADVWQVPAGHSSENLYLQANDDPVSDNQGEARFTVEICAAGWCFEVDLTGDLPDWLTLEYGTKTANGIEAQTGYGYRPDTEDQAYGSRVGYHVTMPEAGHITGIDTLVDWSIPVPDWDTNGVRNTYSWSDTYVDLGDLLSDPTVYSTTPDHSVSQDEEFTKVFGSGWAGEDSPPYSQVTLTKIKFWGTGANPFGENNC
jgi:hypothetical protein